MQPQRQWDIFGESWRIIYSYKRIITPITLIFIFPLTLFFMAQTEASIILYTNFIHNESVLKETIAGSSMQQQLSDLIFSKSYILWFIRFAYITLFFPSFSLIPTSAVVYTVVSVYSDRKITFKNIAIAILAAWRKQSIITHLYKIFELALSVIGAVIFIVVSVTLLKLFTGYDLELTLAGVYLVMSLIYQSFESWLSSIVSVSEDSPGFSAMKKKSMKFWGRRPAVEYFIFVQFCIYSGNVYIAFEEFVHGELLNMPSRVVLGILCYLVLAMFILFVLVVQTVMYLCTSDPSDNVKMTAISRSSP